MLVDDGDLILCMNLAIYRINVATGAVVWSYDLGNETTIAPVQFLGKIAQWYIVVMDKTLMEIDSEKGTLYTNKQLVATPNRSFAALPHLSTTGFLGFSDDNTTQGRVLCRISLA